MLLEVLQGEMMKVLMTNVQLMCGGSETWTYTMAKQLISRGHSVEFYSVRCGEWKPHFDKLGTVHQHFNDNYDLILCNHNSCQQVISSKSCPMIRTCHGPEVRCEQPMRGADYYVSVSPEVQKNLEKRGFTSEVIRNGIDADLYKPTREPQETAETVLYMTDFPDMVPTIRNACEKLGLKLNVIGFGNKVWEPVKELDEADIVISLGRGAYEGLMMDKQVLVYDQIGDGWLNPRTWPTFVDRNCSGRTNRYEWTERAFEKLLQEYQPSNGENRNLAFKEHNASDKCDDYLRIARNLGVKC